MKCSAVLVLIACFEPEGGKQGLRNLHQYYWTQPSNVDFILFFCLTRFAFEYKFKSALQIFKYFMQNYI